MKRRKRNTKIINIPLNISILTNSQPHAQVIDEQADNRKVAIDAYRFQVERYQTFMNYFALFNGALLVAFCTLLTSTTTITNIPNTCCKICFENKYILSNQYQLLLIMISILGIIVSIIWDRSIIGNETWMKSWMELIRNNEQKDVKNPTKETLHNTIVSEDASDLAKNTLKGFYSTQKLTLAFVRFVIGAWGIALLYTLLDAYDLHDKLLNQIYFTLILIIGIGCIGYVYKKDFYSDVSGMNQIKPNSYPE